MLHALARKLLSLAVLLSLLSSTAIAATAPIPDDGKQAPPKSSPTPSPTPPKVEFELPCECAKKSTLICLGASDLERICGVGAGACAIQRTCTIYALKEDYICTGKTKATSETKPEANGNVMFELPLDQLYAESGFYESNSVQTEVINQDFVNYLREKYTVNQLLSNDWDLMEAAFGMVSTEEAQTAVDSVTGNEKATDIQRYCMYIHELRHLCEFSGVPCTDEIPAIKDQIACLFKYLKAYCEQSTAEAGREELCRQLCHYTAMHQSELRFTESFCLSNKDKTACCKAYEICTELPEPPPGCKSEWIDPRRVTEHCNRRIGSGVHTCEYFAGNPELANLECRR